MECLADMGMNESENIEHFNEYLQDEIFVDYFNTFLSLPIFPRKFLYRPKRQKFDVDPPFKNFQIDKKILSTWICCERLPLFWKTDLFLGYLLCKMLISFPDNETKQVSQMVDGKALRKHIGSLIGMQNFRQYTKNTMGECILNFWCEAEKFRRYTSAEMRRFVFRDIQFKYLKNGSAYEVPDNIKQRVYGEEMRGKAFRTITKNVSIFSADTFKTAQSLVVESLSRYWVPKYILHRCREIATTFQQRRLSRAIVAGRLQNEKIVRVDPLKTVREDDNEKDIESDVLLEDVAEDGTFEGEKNEFFEKNRLSSSESEYGDVEKISSKGSPELLPEIKQSSHVFLASKDVKEVSEYESLKLPSLSPTSPISEISCTSEDESPIQNEASQRKHTRRFDIKEFLELSTPFAMAENVETVKMNSETCLQKQCQERRSVLLDRVSKTNLAQIIKPYCHQEIPKTPLSAHFSISSIWNMKGKSAEQSLFVLAITSDRFAGSPFKTYLKSTENMNGLTKLQFWEDIQAYIAMTQSTVVDLKYRLGRNLVVTYLQRESIREVYLESRLRDRLCYMLRRGQADMILSKTSDRILEALYEPWQSFVQSEKENLKVVVKMNTKRKSLCTEEAMQDGGEEVTFRTLRALNLAMCLGQGDFQPLDDEEDDDEMTSEGEENEEEEDEGSLRKRRLTVVNEEAAVALAMGNEQEDSQENSRRKSHYYGRVRRKPRKSSIFETSTFKTRPSKPKNFTDILNDPVQLLWFKRFLSDHDALTPLKFWQDVEKMHKQSKDSRARQTKARVIVKQYFANTDDPSKNLQCRADIIKDIPRIEHVTPAMLVSAQSCVIRSLEEQWFSRYIATFPEDAKEEDVSQYAARNTLMGLTKMASRGKTRGLWALFGHSMMTFIRGVTKPESVASFIQFLQRECKYPNESRKHRGEQNPNHGINRRIINNRVISAEYLVNDLKFWLEVQRYKELCDGASACAMAGNYTMDDEKMIQHKARTLLDCYLESALPPKVQINIPAEMAESISYDFKAGIIDRGIFHDAEIYVFCTLINYWKKFLARDTRFDVVIGKESGKRTKKKTRQKSREKDVCVIDGLSFKKVALGEEEDILQFFRLNDSSVINEEPRLCFSLQTGLKLVS